MNYNLVYIWTKNIKKQKITKDSKRKVIQGMTIQITLKLIQDIIMYVQIDLNRSLVTAQRRTIGRDYISYFSDLHLK